jgi:hypothetical protein
MPVIRLNLDPQTFHRLTEAAVDECRPIAWQAEVLLLRALGLPAPPRCPCVAVEAAESEGAPHGH